MGRLSTFAKNRILNLRFQKSFRIKQIALTLLQEDNIKVSRKSISTFLKKYIETKSIHDKPRSGRNKKLTPEEINLIGEVTRLNRDITAPKIKEYLNLNVSTYTILRASKLFEWNKLNPNSNEAKKAAALERQLNGESKRRRASKKRTTEKKPASAADTSASEADNEKPEFKNQIDYNLNLVDEADILMAKNVSSSPMVFATKILYKIFDISELVGHNVSGKTFNKHIKNKKALDEKRINYIKWLVENQFESNNKEELWKSCRTAINKSIRNIEIKGFAVSPNNGATSQHHRNHLHQIIKLSMDNIDDLASMEPSASKLPNETINSCTNTFDNLHPNLRVFQITDIAVPALNDSEAAFEPQVSLDQSAIERESKPSKELSFSNSAGSARASSICTRSQRKKAETSTPVVETETATSDENGALSSRKRTLSASSSSSPASQQSKSKRRASPRISAQIKDDNDAPDEAADGEGINLNLLSANEILEMKSLYCSPMIFATKVLVKIFSKEELLGHNVSGKTFHRNLKNKEPLDEKRIMYIKWLIEKYFSSNDGKRVNVPLVWKSCRKAINRIIRNYEAKEANKSTEEATDDDDDADENSDASSEYRPSTRAGVRNGIRRQL